MQFKLDNDQSAELYNDFKEFLDTLEEVHSSAIKVLVDFHGTYLLKYKKPWFRKKMNLKQFLRKITFNTSLVIYDKDEHNVPFKHVRPETYIWTLKDKKLAKLTCNSVSDREFIKKSFIISLAVMEVFDLVLIRDVQQALERMDRYGKEPFSIGDNTMKLHEKVLKSTERMKSAMRILK